MLLGFDGPTGNTYGSIATVDYLLESASARRRCSLVGVGRLVQDLLLWCTAEVGYLRLADGVRAGEQHHAAEAQSRRARARARARVEGVRGSSPPMPAAVHNTPFGDIVDTEDDLQPLVASAFKDATRAVALVAAAMAAAEFDVARMRARAAEGWVDAHGAGRHAGARSRRAVQGRSRDRVEAHRAARAATPDAPLADLLAARLARGDRPRDSR